MGASKGKLQPLVRALLRWVHAAFMVGIGMLHFVRPEPFVAIMPTYLPWHLALVYVSGLFEIIGGIGLLITRTRSWAGYGLIALYVAVFPANLNMALNDIPLDGEHVDPVVLWARLPAQLVIIALTYWISRPDDDRRD